MGARALLGASPDLRRIAVALSCYGNRGQANCPKKVSLPGRSVHPAIRSFPRLPERPVYRYAEDGPHCWPGFFPKELSVSSASVFVAGSFGKFSLSRSTSQTRISWFGAGRVSPHGTFLAASSRIFPHRFPSRSCLPKKDSIHRCSVRSAHADHAAVFAATAACHMRTASCLMPATTAIFLCCGLRPAMRS